jgi:Protein of unknown function (DUF4038)
MPTSVTFDAVGPSASGATGTTSPLTWTHTCGTGASDLLVGVAVDSSNDGATTCTVTYNGISCSSLQRWESGGAGKTTGFLQVFSLPSPPIGSFTVSVSASGTFSHLAGGSLSFIGSSAMGNLVTADSGGADVTSGTLTLPTYSSTSMAAVFVANGSDLTAFTAGTSEFATAYFGGFSAASAAAATIAGTGGNVTVTWTQTSDYYAAVGVELQSGGGQQQIMPEQMSRQSMRKRKRTQYQQWAVQLPSVTINPVTVAVTAAIPQATVPYQYPYLTQVLGSGTGLYLADQNGRPWLACGDFCWALITNAGQNGGATTWQSDMAGYLSVRASQGYNLIYAGLIGCTVNGGPNDNGETFDGVVPFTGGVPGTLNSAYWTRVDYMISTAASYGITMILNIAPTETFAAGCVLASMTSGQATAYGAALAARYAASPNILWIMGDDYYDTEDTLYSNILTALRSGGDSHLITIENYMETDSRYYAYSGASCAWGLANAQVNLVYTYNASYDLVEYAYTEANHGQIPVVQLDGTWDDYVVRNETNYDWWVLSSGSRGAERGTQTVAYTGTNFISYATSSDTNGVNHGKILAIFASFTGWWQLVPDTSSAFVTAGRGTHVAHLESASFYSPPPYNTYVSASITPSGSLAVVYNPVAANTITCNTSMLGSGWTASWVDPISGATSSAGAGPTYANSATNSYGGNDWVLVFQTPSSLNSGPNYATAQDTGSGGTGTWVNPGNADGAPDGSYATWAVP